MRFSDLQKYILIACWNNGKVKKRILEDFYDTHVEDAKPESRQAIITKSVERLTERGLVRATGTQTKDKWTIHHVTLTPLGKKQARKLLGVQTRLEI